MEQEQQLQAMSQAPPEQGQKAGSQHTITEADIEEEQEKIKSYEDAFREIKEATGVADVNEVIQKFITQEETHKNLLAMTKESQAKIEDLTEKKRDVQDRVQRAAGDGGGARGAGASGSAGCHSHCQALVAGERAATPGLGLPDATLGVHTLLDYGSAVSRLLTGRCALL